MAPEEDWCCRRHRKLTAREEAGGAAGVGEGASAEAGSTGGLTVRRNLAKSTEKKLAALKPDLVNQKMILTLTASIMYWSLKKQPQPESSESFTTASDAASDIASEDSASIAEPSDGEEVNSLPDGMSTS
ncbi:hypothetical protein ABZP36_011655 [Zizania latifolia]